MAKNAVCKKYKEQLGFSSRTVFLCRGSPLAQDVLKYLAGFDILVHEMFGQSENCGLFSSCTQNLNSFINGASGTVTFRNGLTFGKTDKGIQRYHIEIQN